MTTTNQHESAQRALFPTSNDAAPVVHSRPPRYASDADLLATVIGEKEPETAYQLLNESGGLPALFERDARELTRYDGIGPARARLISAFHELMRRVESQSTGERVQVSCPGDVANVYGPLLRDLKQEVFKVVMLSTANVITGDYTASEGGLASSIVEPRAVFKEALLQDAAAVICVHNHPSGNPEPSREDVRITRQLNEAGKIMGVPLHDHLIVAGTSHTSLAERGVVE